MTMAADHVQPVRAHGMADAHDDPGDERQLGVEPLEHLLETRNEEHHQEDQHADCQEQQNGGIKHRRHHLGRANPFPAPGNRRSAPAPGPEIRRFRPPQPSPHRRGERFRARGHGVGQRHAVHHRIVNRLPFGLGGGLEASLQRMTSARLNGTPAASKLDRSRVKFSSVRGETFLDPKLKFSPGAAPAGGAGVGRRGLWAPPWRPLFRKG